MSRVFCAALGIAFEIGRPSRFNRIRIKITTTKVFTILMTEWPIFDAASTSSCHASGASRQYAVPGGHPRVTRLHCQIAVSNHRTPRTIVSNPYTPRSNLSRRRITIPTASLSRRSSGALVTAAWSPHPASADTEKLCRRVGTDQLRTDPVDRLPVSKPGFYDRSRPSLAH